MSTASLASARSSADRHELVRVYVWEVPVRVCHWLIFLSLTSLSVTGVYIGNPFLIVPGEAGGHFVMGWMKAIHSYSAIVFTLSVVSRVVWMFMSNRYAGWDAFVPVHRERRRSAVETAKFYLFARRLPPPVVGHNPLAGLAYTLVYLLFVVQILTGFALFSTKTDSFMHAFSFLVPLFGGLQTARWIHHVVMWLLIGFFVHHVYSAWLVSQVEKNGTMDSIFSGYKFVPRELVEDEVEE